MNLDLYAMGAAMGSWILTYLLHATVLLSVAALAALALRARPELEEAIWKLALVGGLLTASLQPALAVVRPGQPMAEQSAAAATPSAPPAVSSVARISTAVESLFLEPSATIAGNDTWRRLLLAGWASVTLLLLARLATASVSLRRRLAGRRTIVAGPLVRLVDRLLEAAGRRRPVRLTRTRGIPVPIALGAEICMPERALRELPSQEQESVVAHEMAHVLRCDPAWLLAGRVLGALFFFHPLVLLAGRRLRRVAELRCDDWAAAATGRPLALARCLTRVAGWGGEVMPATAMAGDPRWLAGRVTRLLDRERPRQAGPAPRWLRPAGAAALVAVALWMPGISLAGDTGTPPEAPAAAPDPVIAPLPPLPVAAPVVAPAPLPGSAPAPVVAPPGVAVPLPPLRPAFAIPAPGPPVPEPRAPEDRQPAELAMIEAMLAAEMAELENGMVVAEREAMMAQAEAYLRQGESDLDRDRQRQRVERQARLSAEERDAVAEEARRLADRALETSRAHRKEIERELLRARNGEREELRRLAEELASARAQVAQEIAAHRQLIAEELVGQRRALAEEARRIAALAEDTAIDLEVDRERQRALARQMAVQAEQARAQARLEMERLAPELEKLRLELQLRTEQREQLRRELEILRREVEELRREDG